MPAPVIIQPNEVDIRIFVDNAGFGNVERTAGAKYAAMHGPMHGPPQPAALRRASETGDGEELLPSARLLSSHGGGGASPPAGKGGASPPTPQPTQPFVMRVEFAVRRSLVGQSLKDKAKNHKDPFAHEIKAYLEGPMANYAIITQYNVQMSSFQLDENLSQIPIPKYTPTPNPSDSTVIHLSTVRNDKPWCDYSTETGRPGVDSDGTVYDDSSRRYSIFCDGLHDGLLVVNGAGFSDPDVIPADPVASQIKVLIRSTQDAKKSSTMEVRLGPDSLVRTFGPDLDFFRTFSRLV